MGCTSSIPVTSRSIHTTTPRVENGLSPRVENGLSPRVGKQTPREPTVKTIATNELTDIDTNSNVQEKTTVRRKEQPAIAFAVDMDGNELQRVIGSSGAPKKLQGLEPLNVPRFTSEMLAEKQKQIDCNSQKLEEKLKKAKLQREMKKQAFIDKQKQQEEYAKRVREKAKKFKETANQDADTRPWGYSADEGDSDQSSDSLMSTGKIIQTNTKSTHDPSFNSRQTENNDNFFDT